jgi:molecular chaperone IbpA
MVYLTTKQTGPVGFIGPNMVTQNFWDIFNDPFFIGFNDQLSRLMGVHNNSLNASYPPYNVIKEDEDNFTVELALAGYSKTDIDVKVEEGTVVVSGEIEDKSPETYVHKGIANRKFTRSFALGEYMEVQSAAFNNGMLSIKVERIVPEDKKPKTIKIK